MEHSKRNIQLRPPIAADQFLEFFCKEEWIEPIKGDIYEQYIEDRKSKSKWRADVNYWIHIFTFLRPFAIKNKSHNLKTTTMYRSYIKFAWRNMGKHRLDTFMNITSLSVGIACFIFIFLYLQGELSYDQFHKDADDIHRVVIDFVDSNGRRIPDATTNPALSPALIESFPEVQYSTRIFPTWGSAKLMGPSADRKFQEEKIYRVDSSFFYVFDFPLVSGNKTTALSDKSNIVISETIAKKYFGLEDPIGKTITMFGETNTEYKVSAILKDIPFNSHMHFDMLTVLPFTDIDNNWGWYNFYTYVKLSKQADKSSFEAKLQPFYNEKNIGQEENFNIIYSQPITDIHLKSNLKWELEGNGDIKNVYIFSALALFVLLISIINYLNLTIANAFKRAKEVGVRKVFGAHRKSLMSQFTVETCILILTALIVGTFLCELMFRNMAFLLGREMTVLDTSMLIFYISISGIALFAGLIAGIYPAIHLSSFKITSVVRGIVSKSGIGVKKFRKVLLVLQFSISIFMLIGTLVVFQQLKYANQSNLGFDKEHVLIIPNSSAIENKDIFKNKILQSPHIKNVGFSSGLMGGINWTTNIGYPDPLLINFALVDPEYINVMNYKFLKGGNFQRERATHQERFSLILNETAVEALNINTDELEESFAVRSENDSLIYGRLIGVVEDFHYTNFKSEIKPFAFLMRDNNHQYIAIKMDGAELTQTIETIEKAWNKVVPGIPMSSYFQDDAFAQLYDSEEKLSTVLTFLTILAIFIAFMGMFAMINLVIKDKIKEIAIRKVLGAGTNSLIILVAKNFIAVILIANALAWPMSWFVMNKWLNGFAYRIELTIWFFILSILASLVVAGITVGYKSMQAAKNNPVDSLSYE